MCGGLRLQCEAQTVGRGSSDSRKKKHAQSVSFETVEERKTFDVFWTRQSLRKGAIRWIFANAKRGWNPCPLQEHNILALPKVVLCVYYFCFTTSYGGVGFALILIFLHYFWWRADFFILFFVAYFLWWTKKGGFRWNLFIQFQQPTEDRTRFLFLTIRGITSISSRLTLTQTAYMRLGFTKS